MDCLRERESNGVNQNEKLIYSVNGQFPFCYVEINSSSNIKIGGSGCFFCQVKMSKERSPFYETKWA